MSLACWLLVVWQDLIAALGCFAPTELERTTAAEEYYDKQPTSVSDAVLIGSLTVAKDLAALYFFFESSCARTGPCVYVLFLVAAIDDLCAAVRCIANCCCNDTWRPMFLVEMFSC